MIPKQPKSWVRVTAWISKLRSVFIYMFVAVRCDARKLFFPNTFRRPFVFFCQTNVFHVSWDSQVIVRRAFTAPGWKLGGYCRFVDRPLVILVRSCAEDCKKQDLTLGLLMALNGSQPLQGVDFVLKHIH